MSTRVLLLSNVRPSRAWKMANRIAQEIPGACVCGVVQRPTRRLPFEQQLIAAGNVRCATSSAFAIARLYGWLQLVTRELFQAVLWFIHGCPRRLAGMTEFTTETLEKRCRSAGWPLLVAEDLNDVKVAAFVRRQRPQLTILLGEVRLNRELIEIPTAGCIRACQGRVPQGPGKTERGTEIAIDHLARASEPTFPVAQLKLPWQPYDGEAGHTLKADLITDDLLLQVTLGVLRRNGQTAVAVAEWMRTILWPSLRQTELASGRSTSRKLQVRPFRHLWKLSLDTLLLCSPALIARNWYRRMRTRYPVLILTHHVVTDRPHRLGISTEAFWRQARFLQRHYRIVSLSESVELLHHGSVSVPTTALTFDDGYADNFLCLRAVADEMEIPVTHFIVTRQVENHEEFEHDVASGQRGALPMTWDQIRYWHQRGAEFGSHTRTHFDCASTDRIRLKREIVESRNDIEAQLGKRVSFFAFPFGGRENISSEALEIAAGAYEHFASGFGGDNASHSEDCNQHLFRRNLYPHPWELELELQSVFDWVERIKRFLHFAVLTPSSSRTPLPALSRTMSSNTNPESRLMVL